MNTKKTSTQHTIRSHGFRMSLTDIVFIILGITATYYLWPHIHTRSLIIPFIIIHFFLFCNIFRIPRRPELIWAASFILNTGIWHIYGGLNLYWIFGLQVTLSVILITMEIKTPHYHGIFSEKINPHINEYTREEI